MRTRRIARTALKAALGILSVAGLVWLLLPSQFAGAATQGVARDHAASVSAPQAPATIPSQPLGQPPRPPTPTPTPPPPRDVPEADTVLLIGGGMSGLATWLGWQWRQNAARKNN